MTKNVSLLQHGVKINFTQNVKKQNIVTMVENCSQGKCDCMSDETKKKIKEITVLGQDGNVEIDIRGEITTDEIEQALAKSKVVNNR